MQIKNIQVTTPALDIFRSLYENGNFRKELIVTLCDLRNYNYEKREQEKQLTISLYPTKSLQMILSTAMVLTGL